MLGTSPAGTGEEMQHTRTTRHLAAALLAALVTVLASALLVVPQAANGSTGAAQRADTTPPTVRLSPYARPLVGAQIFTGYDGDPAYLEYWQLDHVLTWRTSDPSGICSQAVTWQSYEYLGSEEDPVLGGAVDTFAVPRTARRAVVPNLNAANWGRVPDRFLVRVTDCAGNTATSAIALSELGTREDTDSAIVYRRLAGQPLRRVLGGHHARDHGRRRQREPHLHGLGPGRTGDGEGGRPWPRRRVRGRREEGDRRHPRDQHPAPCRGLAGHLHRRHAHPARGEQGDTRPPADRPRHAPAAQRRRRRVELHRLRRDGRARRCPRGSLGGIVCVGPGRAVRQPPSQAWGRLPCRRRWRAVRSPARSARASGRRRRRGRWRRRGRSAPSSRTRRR